MSEHSDNSGRASAGDSDSALDFFRDRFDVDNRLLEGVLDSTLERGLPLQLRVGEAPLTGMNEGLIGMRPGGKRRLVIPASLAYGDEGVPGLVPGGATIVIEVELLRRFED